MQQLLKTEKLPRRFPPAEIVKVVNPKAPVTTLPTEEDCVQWKR